MCVGAQFHPIIRGSMAGLVGLELCLSILYFASKSGAVTFALLESERHQDALRLSVWAMWPLCALFIASTFMSKFGGTFSVRREFFLFLGGGIAPWCLTGAFGYYDVFTETRWWVSIGVPLSMIGGSFIMFGLAYRVKRMVHDLGDETTAALVRENFATLSYMIIPIMYLSLEGIGLLIGGNALDGMTNAESFALITNIVKVNFQACIHIFGIAVVRIYFAPFAPSTIEDILKGNIGRRIGAELALFGFATMIVMLVLSTRMATLPTKETLTTFDKIRSITSVMFLASWWIILISEAGYLVQLGSDKLAGEKLSLAVARSNSKSIDRDARSSSCENDGIGTLAEAGGGGASLAITGSRAVMKGSHEGGRSTSVSSASAGSSLGSYFTLSHIWRACFASVPLFATPMVSLFWIFTGGKPYPFIYLAFMPVNILCSYVVFFSAPEYSGTPWFEIVTFFLGGPVVIMLGGIAELRWSRGDSEEERR